MITNLDREDAWLHGGYFVLRLLQHMRGRTGLTCANRLGTLIRFFSVHRRSEIAAMRYFLAPRRHVLLSKIIAWVYRSML